MFKKSYFTITIKVLVNKIFYFIFKREPGPVSQRLIKNFFFASSGVGIAYVITFTINTIAIRFLGPLEFGKWTLIESIAGFLSVLPLWGMNQACLRYLGAEKEKKAYIIGSSFLVVVFFFFLAFTLYLPLSSWLIKFLKIDAGLKTYILLYSAIFAFFCLFQAFYQGLEKFRSISLLWIFSALLSASVISAFLYLQNLSFKSLWLGNLLRMTVVILAGLWLFRKFLFKFERATFKSLFQYGTFCMLSSFAGLLSLGDLSKLIINYFLGPATVGLYSAYYATFSIITVKIINVFSQVFIPIASGYKDLNKLYKMVIIFMKKTLVLFLAGNTFIIWTLFQFYGKNYIFDWRLAFMMSLNITLYIFLMILGNLIASIGPQGAKIGSLFAFSAAAVNVSLNAFLIPRFQLFGAMISTTLTTITLMSAAIYVIKVKVVKTRN